MVVFDEDLTVECRRYPPTLLATGDPGVAGQQWPVVAATDWCGEWRTKELH